MNRKNTTATMPAVAMTLISMILTLFVIADMLRGLMPWYLALLIAAGLDGAWITTLAYERRLARQGDRSGAITAAGWGFGVLATGILVAHAVMAPAGMAGWLAVAWLPLAAKALWMVHGLWESTALSPAALRDIERIRQTARDESAVARARLAAQAGAEVTRLEAVTAAGARVAKVQARTAQSLSGAWDVLSQARESESTGRALTCVTGRVTADEAPSWVLPVWGEYSPVPELPAAAEGPVMSDAELDRIVAELRDSENPPMSYRTMAAAFRKAGHSAGEVRLRAAWRRVTAESSTTA